MSDFPRRQEWRDLTEEWAGLVTERHYLLRHDFQSDLNRLHEIDVRLETIDAITNEIIEEFTAWTAAQVYEPPPPLTDEEIDYRIRQRKHPSIYE